MRRLIKIYDTTLRAGTQGEGVSFSMEDKVRLATRLDAMGIHYIEGGWPGSNPKDLRFFARIQDVALKHARLAAFSMTPRTEAPPSLTPTCGPSWTPARRWRPSWASRGTFTSPRPSARHCPRTSR